MSDEDRSIRRVMRPRFERRHQEDRSKEEESGRFSTRPLDVVILTVIGDGRNNAVIPVDLWLKKCQQLVLQGEMPSEWLEGYKQAYERFKNGANDEDDLNGTSLRSWPQIGIEQVEMCEARGVRTVEELAAVDEGSRKFFGPGFVGLQNKARAWLSSASAIARENAELKARLEALEAKISPDVANLIGA